MTKQTFVNYLEQIKGYDKNQVKDILSQMRDFGTPMQDYLTQEEVSEKWPSPKIFRSRQLS